MKPLAFANIHASDLDAGAIARCRANLAAAGVSAAVAVERADILNRQAPAASGIIVTNPPYGVRLVDDDRVSSTLPSALAAFYPKLGDALKQRFAGWTAYFLSGDPRLPKLIGLRASRRTPLYNGALECRLYQYRMVAGSARATR